MWIKRWSCFIHCQWIVGRTVCRGFVLPMCMWAKCLQPQYWLAHPITKKYLFFCLLLKSKRNKTPPSRMFIFWCVGLSERIRSMFLFDCLLLSSKNMNLNHWCMCPGLIVLLLEKIRFFMIQTCWMDVKTIEFYWHSLTQFGCVRISSS